MECGTPPASPSCRRKAAKVAVTVEHHDSRGKTKPSAAKRIRLYRRHQVLRMAGQRDRHRRASWLPAKESFLLLVKPERARSVLSHDGYMFRGDSQILNVLRRQPANRMWPSDQQRSIHRARHCENRIPRDDTSLFCADSGQTGGRSRKYGVLHRRQSHHIIARKAIASRERREFSLPQPIEAVLRGDPEVALAILKNVPDRVIRKTICRCQPIDDRRAIRMRDPHHATLSGSDPKASFAIEHRFAHLLWRKMSTPQQSRRDDCGPHEAHLSAPGESPRTSL